MPTRTMFITASCFLISLIISISSPVLGAEKTFDRAVVYGAYATSELRSAILEDYPKVSKDNYKEMIKKIKDMKTDSISMTATKIRFAIDTSVKAGDTKLAHKYINELDKMGDIPYGYSGSPLAYDGQDSLLYAKADSIMQKIKLADLNNDKNNVIKYSNDFIAKYPSLKMSADVMSIGYSDILYKSVLHKYLETKIAVQNISELDAAIQAIKIAIMEDQYDVFSGLVMKSGSWEDKFTYGGGESDTYEDPDVIDFSLRYRTGDFYEMYQEMKKWIKTYHTGKYSISYNNDIATVSLNSNIPNIPLNDMYYRFKNVEGYWRLKQVVCIYMIPKAK